MDDNRLHTPGVYVQEIKSNRFVPLLHTEDLAVFSSVPGGPPREVVREIAFGFLLALKTDRLNRKRHGRGRVLKAIRRLRSRYSDVIAKLQRPTWEQRVFENCYCANVKMPPCSWCTDPKNDPDAEDE